MSTNQKIIDRALGELGIVEAGDSANATDSATALDTLNNMMAEKEQQDMEFNWFPQDDLTADIPLPRWAESGVTSMLGMYCAAEFRVPLTNELAMKADKGETAILNVLINMKLEGADMSHLAQGENMRWNINNGGY